jgi:hypothetical protein
MQIKIIKSDQKLKMGNFCVPAAAPFPALARRQALLAGVAAAVSQISRAARLRHRVHHSGAGHRVDESGLLAACNTQGENIHTSVQVRLTELFMWWRTQSRKF